ncbi:Broad specificity phosphatase PhoE [Lachnospiraceae bacterium A10]|nr:Broad specificity phosphatase PhoE [Lachnospiraceae bacterium A10]
MDFWINLQIHRWYSAAWLLIYAVSLIILYVKRKKWGENIGYVILFTLSTALIMYCPLVAKTIVGRLLPTYLEYERLSWLMFIDPICAFVVIKIIQGQERIKRCKTVAVLLVLLLCISDVTIISRDYSMAENYMKVPDDVVIISDTLIEDIENAGVSNRPIVMVQEDENRGMMGGWMSSGIRQYTSAPIVNPVVITPEEYTSDGFKLDNYGVMDCQYLVCSKDSNVKKQAIDIGFQVLVDGERYSLLKNTKTFAVYFVRHGQTYANVENVFAGSGTDTVLTEEGIEQAYTVGLALSNINFSDVYTSDMTRTQETADEILMFNKNTVPEKQVNSLLTDIYWGEIEGLSIDEVYERYPDFNYDTYIGLPDDTGFVSPIGAWSKASVINRYKVAFWNIAMESQDRGNALVVGHSSMSWYLQAMFPNQISDEDKIDNASITILNYDSGVWSLQCFNLSAEEYKELGL